MSHETIEGLVAVGVIAKIFNRTPLTILKWRQYEGLPYVVIRGDRRDSVRYRVEDVLTWGREHNKTLSQEYTHATTSETTRGRERVRLIREAADSNTCAIAGA